MDKLTLLKKEIKRIISNSVSKTDPEHSRTTLQWLLKLKPNADTALQIAALAHDIERGTRKKSNEKVKNYEKSKEEHAKKSAEMIGGLLKKYKFDTAFISKVKKLVLKHEVGGDTQSEVLKNADSLSFFQSNLEGYYKRHDEKTAAFKIKYMYDRMSKKSKQIAGKFKYKNKELNELFKKAISS